jgi:hypothetical protein
MSSMEWEAGFAEGAIGRDAHKILSLLDNPPKPNKALKGAVRRSRFLVSNRLRKGY